MEGSSSHYLTWSWIQVKPYRSRCVIQASYQAWWLPVLWICAGICWWHPGNLPSSQNNNDCLGHIVSSQGRKCWSSWVLSWSCSAAIVFSRRCRDSRCRERLMGIMLWNICHWSYEVKKTRSSLSLIEEIWWKWIVLSLDWDCAENCD